MPQLLCVGIFITIWLFILNFQRRHTHHSCRSNAGFLLTRHSGQRLTRNYCRRWWQRSAKKCSLGATTITQAHPQRPAPCCYTGLKLNISPKDADGSLSTFNYYFAQREAVETVIWLYEVKQARDKFDLLRFDASGAVSSGMFDEDWPRYVIKMATGAGKTKVLSLLIAWSFFHKLYETDSTLSRNFLVIAPNIIVLDRLRADFDGLKIFFNDPILPDNGYEGFNWRDDFQMTLHIQDEVRIVRDVGNLFLTNIHRVFLGDVSRSHRLKTTTCATISSRRSGQSRLARRPTVIPTSAKSSAKIEELAVFNDEAHHIHNPKMAWFKSIQDIHHRMLQKDRRLALQVDVTATPRHDNGAIFVQTVSDYPLVEAIHQNVVKHPILPDAPSRAKLQEQKERHFHGKVRRLSQAWH